ncbi:MAG TPA: YceI family protein, partial [Candidatus Acidoferrum sp.]|nr:YceI family protein [Candidatus Acidoferrum sp.]
MLVPFPAAACRRSRRLVLVGLCSLSVLLWARPHAAAADELSLDFDPAQSTVTFALGAFLHSVHGTFALRQGTIHFDPATGQADGNVVVDLASGQSGDPKRDANMRNDVLQVQTYPYAVFTPTHVAGRLSDGGPTGLDADGILSIHGERHPITLHVIAETKDGRLTVQTHMTVPYVQWGMKDPSTFLLRV